MTSVALKGLAGRKLRAVLTALSIVLGVAMIAGTFVLTDTINKGFHSVFTGSYKNTSAVITSKVAFTGDNGADQTPPSFPASVLTRVRALPDVKAAAGSVTDEQTKLIDKSGKTIGSGGGAPNLAYGIDPGLRKLNPLTLVQGHWPSGSGEVAIDKATAAKKGFAVGDQIGIETHSGVHRSRVVGIVELSGVSSIGGATIAAFDLRTAQDLLGKQHGLDVIRVEAKPDVPASRLLSEIRPLLPPTAQVRDAAAQAKEDAKSVNGFTSFLQKALLAFGGIALFVGGFVITNTLSITVAQRTREFATLRTIGATRRQILRSVLLEALVIGAFASLLGLAVGFGLAKGLSAAFTAVGLDLPKAGTVFAPRTVIVSLLVGTLVTVLASFRPARRATRVPPIAAVREGSVLPPGRLARFGPPAGIGVLALGTALVCYGAFVHHISVAQHLIAMGFGCVLMFVGMSIFAPKVVRPLASVLGWPGRRVGGVAGELAVDNARRNPARTASTAAALMIALALVTFVTVFAQGLRSGFEGAVDNLFRTDYALATSNFAPLSAAAADRVAATPGIQTISSVRAGSGRIFGKTVNVSAVDKGMSKVLHVEWYRGSPAVPARLGQDGAFVDKSYAKDHGLSLGSPLALETPTGRILHLRLKGIFTPPQGGSPFGTVTISTGTFDANYANPENQLTLIRIVGGVSAANTAKLERAAAAFPDAKIETQAQFKHEQEKFIFNLLNLLYVLLGLSVIISLFGIVNTLVLSVFERTRELGMLRAVGMTRRQVRRMIRHESVVTSLIGGALGIGLGVFLGFLISQALKGNGVVFALPYGRLLVFVLVTVLIGIVAAVLPARRAARLNVLSALQYE
ncbi:MAG TPA: ABC transporter permease [Gaiellaceae bacterium]